MYDRTNGSDSTTSRGMTTTTLSGFVLGAVLGAGVALLLAPASGVETRRRLGTAARRIRDDAKRRMDRGRQMVDGIRQDASVAVDAGREAVRRRHEGRLDSQTTLESSTPSEFR